MILENSVVLSFEDYAAMLLYIQELERHHANWIKAQREHISEVFERRAREAQD